MLQCILTPHILLFLKRAIEQFNHVLELIDFILVSGVDDHFLVGAFAFQEHALLAEIGDSALESFDFKGQSFVVFGELVVVDLGVGELLLGVGEVLGAGRELDGYFCSAVVPDAEETSAWIAVVGGERFSEVGG